MATDARSNMTVFQFGWAPLLAAMKGKDQFVTELTQYRPDGSDGQVLKTMPFDLTILRHGLEMLDASTPILTDIARDIQGNCSLVNSKTGNYVHDYKCYITRKDGDEELEVREDVANWKMIYGGESKLEAWYYFPSSARFLAAPFPAVEHYGQMAISFWFTGPGTSRFKADGVSRTTPTIAVEMQSLASTRRKWESDTIELSWGTVRTAENTYLRPPDLSAYLPLSVSTYTVEGKWLAQGHPDWPGVEDRVKAGLREVLERERKPLGACTFQKTLWNDPDEIILIN